MPHVDIELEDNKQFISNIPRIVGFAFIYETLHLLLCLIILLVGHGLADLILLLLQIKGQGHGQLTPLSKFWVKFF